MSETKRVYYIANVPELSTYRIKFYDVEIAPTDPRAVYIEKGVNHQKICFPYIHDDGNFGYAVHPYTYECYDTIEEALHHLWNIIKHEEKMFNDKMRELKDYISDLNEGSFNNVQN